MVKKSQWTLDYILTHDPLNLLEEKPMEKRIIQAIERMMVSIYVNPDNLLYLLNMGYDPDLYYKAYFSFIGDLKRHSDKFIPNGRDLVKVIERGVWATWNEISLNPERMEQIKNSELGEYRYASALYDVCDDVGDNMKEILKHLEA